MKAHLHAYKFRGKSQSFSGIIGKPRAGSLPSECKICFGHAGEWKPRFTSLMFNRIQ